MKLSNVGLRLLLYSECLILMALDVCELVHWDLPWVVPHRGVACHHRLCALQGASPRGISLHGLSLTTLGLRERHRLEPVHEAIHNLSVHGSSTCGLEITLTVGVGAKFKDIECLLHVLVQEVH